MELRLRAARPWYFPRALRREDDARGRRPRTALAAGAAALLLAGCGGPVAQQDEDEPQGRYKVEVVKAEFPTEQKMAKRSTMEIAVRNVDARTIPNIAVTVSSFDIRGADEDSPNADPARPIFAVNKIPKGGDTAYLDTYALGNLRPGQTKTFRWDVTAIYPGAFRLKYRIAAGLDGKAVAVLPNGDPPAGEFVGTVERAAPVARVGADGETIIRDGERIGPRDR